VYVWAMGNMSCGQWITERQKDPEGMTVSLAVSWITGFVTGLNAFLPSTSLHSKEVGSHTDLPSLIVWLDGYCQQHPLDKIYQAPTFFYGYARAQGKSMHEWPAVRPPSIT